MRWPFSRRKPVAEAPTRRPHREWAGIEPLRPVGLRPEPEVASAHAFQSRLATRWQQEPILAPLGHELNLSAPAGLVSAVSKPVEGYANAPDLPILPVVGAAAPAPAPVIPPVPVVRPLKSFEEDVRPRPTTSAVPEAHPEPAPAPVTAAAEDDPPPGPVLSRPVPSSEPPPEAAAPAEAPTPFPVRPSRRLGRVGPPLSVDPSPPAVLRQPGPEPAPSWEPPKPPPLAPEVHVPPAPGLAVPEWFAPPVSDAPHPQAEEEVAPGPMWVAPPVPDSPRVPQLPDLPPAPPHPLAPVRPESVEAPPVRPFRRFGVAAPVERREPSTASSAEPDEDSEDPPPAAALDPMPEPAPERVRVVETFTEIPAPPLEPPMPEVLTVEVPVERIVETPAERVLMRESAQDAPSPRLVVAAEPVAPAPARPLASSQVSLSVLPPRTAAVLPGLASHRDAPRLTEPAGDEPPAPEPDRPATDLPVPDAPRLPDLNLPDLAPEMPWLPAPDRPADTPPRPFLPVPDAVSGLFAPSAPSPDGAPQFDASPFEAEPFAPAAFTPPDLGTILGSLAHQPAPDDDYTRPRPAFEAPIDFDVPRLPMPGAVPYLADDPPDAAPVPIDGDPVDELDDEYDDERLNGLASDLYDRIRDRLRRELLVDRERSLMLTDWR